MAIRPFLLATDSTQTHIVNRTHLLTIAASLWGLATLATTAIQAQDAAAQRLYREAQRLEADDRQSAIDAYALLLEQFPRDRLAPAALLRTANLHRAAREPAKTEFALERLIGDYGRSPEAAAGFLTRGEIQLAVARTAAELEDARATVRRVPLLFGPSAYPDLPARAEARLLEGRVSRLLGDDASAEASFITIIEDEPPGATASLARFALARLLIDRGAWQPAAEILQRTVDQAGREGNPGAGSPADNAAPSSDPIALEVAASGAERRLLALVHRRIIRPIATGKLFMSQRRMATGQALRAPARVAAHEDGRLLVVDESSPTVAVLAPDGRVLGRGTVRDAAAPWWDRSRPTLASGDTWVQPFGGRSAQLTEPGKGNGPLKGMLAAVRGALGDRFVVARGETGVLRYTVPRLGAVLMGDAKEQFVDLAADAHGRIYALDRNADQVRRIGVDRVPEPGVLLAGDWKRPVAIAADALGWVFVLDRGNRRLDVFDDAGNRVASIGPTLADGSELRAPTDVTVDGEGRVTIADPKLAALVVLE